MIGASGPRHLVNALKDNIVLKQNPALKPASRR